MRTVRCCFAIVPQQRLAFEIVEAFNAVAGQFVEWCSQRRSALHKVFHRRETTYPFCLDRLNDDILGYSKKYKSWHKKDKVVRAANQLLESGIIRLPTGSTSLREEFVKIGKGKYEITFHRGPKQSRLRQNPSCRDEVGETVKWS